uniref:Trichome birefringence-like N-terminal domain-containing protein n=1 Tax=Kalanchoe fedtschenkoi TaxID=63787 RepID=A0A7N0RFB4_KALFE
MTVSLSKGFSGMAAFPHKLSSIVVTVGGLAAFLVLGSLLISHPISSAITGYVYNANRSVNALTPAVGISQSGVTNSDDGNANLVNKGTNDASTSQAPPNFSNSETTEIVDKPVPVFPLSSTPQQVDSSTNSGTPSGSETVDPLTPKNSDRISSGSDNHSADSSPKTPEDDMPSSLNEGSSTNPVNSDCDLYHGQWIYDSSGPLYTNNTCPVLTQMQNCQGNGRPDNDYENYRWKPAQCDLPRFDARKFLDLMRGKTLAFIGDSVARNQMESLLCILWQVEAPKNRGNRKMQRWYFKSTNVMIVRIWSSWLVHRTSEPFDFAPAGVDKLHLDLPDETFMEFVPTFDVVVLSSGHWFAKQSVYILNNQIVGGQLWWPDKSRPQKINNVQAFGISVETMLTALATHPNYTGLTIVRSYSPDHYEGGAWNTGGSCTGKMKPATELVENGFTNVMHKQQVTGFNKAAKKQKNSSKLRLMDITEAFGYRHDGHPGPYRNPDPNKITKRGPDGKPPPQDCLHWCMPGPVDTWNELVMEIIRREAESSIMSS